LFWKKDEARLSVLAQPEGGGEAFATDPALFPTGRWVFVACVADGEFLRLYRDGMQVDAAPCHGLQPRPQLPSLGIGFKTSDDGITPRTTPAPGTGTG